MSDLTQKYLQEILHYNPDTGAFKWAKTRKRVRIGDTAGHIHARGYIHICILSRRYMAHRLAWFYVHGKWPQDEIDHINGVRDDNRIANLREANHVDNQRNRPIPKNNTSGIKGVWWDKKTNKWCAAVRVNGKRRYIGYFTDIAEAEQETIKFREQYHGEFANHGAFSGILHPNFQKRSICDDQQRKD